MEVLEKLKEILEKNNIEKYIFDDNPIIAYFATAFAGHDLIYKIIQEGSFEQKINAIEHGSSKHIKIMLNDRNIVIRKRAIKKAADLEKSIYHEYVTLEKIDMIFNPYSTSMQLSFFKGDSNPFVETIYSSLRNRDGLYKLITNEQLASKIVSCIELTNDEVAEEMDIDLEKSGIAKEIIKNEAKKADEFISKYNFTFKFEHSYQVGILIIEKDGENLVNLQVNYSYHNEKNLLISIYVWETILNIIKEALSVYDTSLDKCDFSSVESFREYRAKRLVMKKLGFSKEELFGILKESNAIFKERGIR
jgi:hypothetical protein